MDVKYRLFLTALACSAFQGVGYGQTAADGMTTTAERIDYYQSRYALDDEADKLTDNHGEGFDALYGTRNFREILSGVAYRGGANNRYHRDDRRDNMNPLPADALENLCREGFGHSFYLYTTNFESAPAVTRCQSQLNPAQTLAYLQKNPNDESQSYDMLQTVFQSIRQPESGPVYLHCWNGWHASGLISAKILRQFCGWSADEAVAYWDENTDGHNQEPRYESIRQRIRDFRPYPDLAITEAEAAMVCPAR